MDNLNDIKRHIKSIKQTLKISMAQKTLASTQISRARKMLEDNKPFHQKIKQTMANILDDIDQTSRFYQSAPRGSNQGILIITADRGLAGGYNQNVLNRLENVLRGTTNIEYSNEQTVCPVPVPGQKPPKILAVGHIGYMRLLHSCDNMDEDFFYEVEKPTLSVAGKIADKILELFETGVVDYFDVIYTQYGSAVHMNAITARLLPLSEADLPEPMLHFAEYEPSKTAVLESLVPLYLKGYIFGCLINAWMCELNSRLTAMDAAIRNGDDMLDDMLLKFNRARQGAITQEITEIVASSLALKA